MYEALQREIEMRDGEMYFYVYKLNTLRLLLGILSWRRSHLVFSTFTHYFFFFSSRSEVMSILCVIFHTREHRHNGRLWAVLQYACKFVCTDDWRIPQNSKLTHERKTHNSRKAMCIRINSMPVTRTKRKEMKKNLCRKQAPWPPLSFLLLFCFSFSTAFRSAKIKKNIYSFLLFWFCVMNSLFHENYNEKLFFCLDIVEWPPFGCCY